MCKKTAIVTGANGQDGSYLLDLLLEKDYKVYGVIRRSSTDKTLVNIKHLFNNPNLELITCDITDFSGINRIINNILPNEIYNLAAMSHVGISFDEPLSTFEINAKAPLNILESIRQHSRHTKFYQASTSELMGDTTESPQNENTRFKPCSPYAVAKLSAHDSVRIYRDGYNLFACAGILYNHESPRRSEQFVTRKITKYVAYVKKFMDFNNGDLPDPQFEDEIDYLYMGNLDAKRDWSHSFDMVNGMWLMLQQDKPKDYVLGSGETRSIRDLLQVAFSYIGVDDYNRFVKIDSKFYRPVDVNLLKADPSLAKKELGWQQKYSFQQLIQEMIDNDYKELLQNG